MRWASDEHDREHRDRDIFRHEPASYPATRDGGVVAASRLVGSAHVERIARSGYPRAMRLLGPLLLVSGLGHCGNAVPAPTTTPSKIEVGKPNVSRVHFAAGTFGMGSPDGDGSPDEHPQHSVDVGAFDLDATEVTVAAYAACVRAGACTAAPTTVEWSGMTDSDKTTWSKYCNAQRDDRKTHAVNCVDFDQATAYCAWAGARLPTEQEWEYAARGKAGRTYPWGEETPDETRANACGAECAAMAKEEGFTWSSMYPGSDGWAGTAPVGTYPAGNTPEGLKDMGGNVWEWTSTTYARYDGSHASASMVLRGGCWDSYMTKSLRAANRISEQTSARRNVIGFRCAASSSR
jgi:formylglycine-generating enzyme required for sulfatase activity